MQDLVEKQCMVSQRWSQQWRSFWYNQGKTIMVYQNNITTSWDPTANIIQVVGEVRTMASTILGHFPTRNDPLPQDSLWVIRPETWIMMTDNSLHFLSKANKLGAVRKDHPQQLNGQQPNSSRCRVPRDAVGCHLKELSTWRTIQPRNHLFKGW